MITFNDIDTVLKTHSMDLLDYNYNLRQFSEKEKNDRKATFLLYRLFDAVPSLGHENDFDKLLAMIAIYMECNPHEKETFKSLLEMFNYHFSSEFLAAMRSIDLYSTHDIDMDCLKSFWYAFFTLSSFKERKGSFSVSLTNGKDFVVEPALEKLGMFIPKGGRRGFCHDMTTLGLLKFPSLVGSYYEIPYFLDGTLEHSVLIDENNQMVYDLAQNTAVPFDVWNSYYTPLFSVTGEEFQELNSKTVEKYHTTINMTTLSEVQRILKKGR